MQRYSPEMGCDNATHHLDEPGFKPGELKKKAVHAVKDALHPA
jgi:hypothetical protein